MTVGFDIRKATVAAIEQTQDPLAAIKMQEGYKSIQQLGKMLTSLTTIDDVKLTTDRLLDGFTDQELGKANPALAIALCVLLSEALIRIGRSFAGDPRVQG